MEPTLPDAELGVPVSLQATAFAVALDHIACTAADRALSCLEDLRRRDSDADHDRGARSAECLMRVASAAAALRAKLEKEEADHADRRRDPARAVEAETERLAERLQRELARLEKRSERDPGPADQGVRPGGDA